MTILAPPRAALVDAALAQARVWCAGHEIDQAPALRHAVAVTVVLGRHHPETRPQVLAATLLHDAPEYAPSDLDLDDFLTWNYGVETRDVVRGLQALTEQMRPGVEPTLDLGQPAVVQAAAADKIIAISSMLRRARCSGDEAAFWSTRRPFMNVLGYFERFRVLAAPVCEADMIDHLADLIAQSREATAPFFRQTATV